MQTKIESLIESSSNIVIGIGISYLISTFVIPYYTGVVLPVKSYIGMTMIYTVVSMVRSYLLRRFWNRRHTLNKVLK